MSLLLLLLEEKCEGVERDLGFDCSLAPQHGKFPILIIGTNDGDDDY